MLERLQIGRVPPKHHIVFPQDPAAGAGAIHHEECLTRDGFDGPYTILYHRHRPHAQHAAEVAHGWELPVAAPAGRLAKRHYLSSDVAKRGGAPVDARVPLLFSRDVVASVAFPDASDPVYFVDGDADTLVYVFEGGGTLRTVLGDVAFENCH